MHDSVKTKHPILAHLVATLDRNIADATAAIEAAKESRNEDTKSSAGDKYETGRAMMQIEIDKNAFQLTKAKILKVELATLNLERAYSKVEPGSLVFTNQGNYFISIGVGKIEVDGESWYAISLASPIGKLLKDKVAGDTVQFQGRTFTILEIA